MGNEENIEAVEKWVNLEDVAAYLSVSKDTIRAWIKAGKIPFYKAGKIPFYKAGKMYKFKLSEVDDYVRNGKITE